jgi:hypothetical protein
LSFKIPGYNAGIQWGKYSGPHRLSVRYLLFSVFEIPTFIGGNLVTATSAPSFTSIGLSITKEIGLSVETFKFTVSGQPDNVKAIETKIINFHIKNI